MMGTVVNLSLHGVIEAFPASFIVIVLVFAFSIMLRSISFVGLQTFLVLTMYVFDVTLHPVLPYIAIGIQFALGIFLFYKYFQALERNYQLILEKTHQAPPHYTKRGTGEQKAFM